MADTITELKQERSEVLKRAHAMLDRAEAEKRDLTAEERDEWDRLLAKADQLKRRIEMAEVGDADDPVLEERSRRARELFLSGLELDRHESEGEWRALAPDESLREHLARRGELGGGFADITPGRFLRSIVLGPRTDAERRALAESTDSAGGFLVPEELAAQFIDLMRRQSVVNRAGATTVPLNSDKTTIARLASDPQPTWRAENALVGESEPTFDQVVFQPRALACLVRASRELLEDAANVEQILTNTLSSALALELDRAALFGSGNANEPRGLVNQAGVQTVDMGDDGAPLTDYAPLLDARLKLLEVNSVDPSVWVMAPRTERQLAGLVDSTGQPLRRPDALAQARFLASTAVPVNETHGAATNASRIITGDWRQLLLGVRSQLRIEVLRERYADQLQYGFLAWLRADVAVAHPEAFVMVTGITPAA